MKRYISDFARFDRENAYYGDDLGAVTIGEITTFRVWAPFCTGVYLNLYTGGKGKNKIETLVMRRQDRGVWSVELMHTCYGYYYTYTLEYEHKEYVETIDIYAKGCGVNGDRGYIPDMKALEPEGWNETPRPVCENAVDAVIYECHVRDFSISENSGVPFEMIAIEITESQSERDFMVMKKCVEELRDTGIKFYLDDFGTGYSNFERIMEVPFDIIKFDRSLTAASGIDVKSETMVQYLARLFTDVSYSVLYEGVETPDDEQRCINMCARYLQGYKYSKPIPFEDLRNYFEKKAV